MCCLSSIFSFQDSDLLLSLVKVCLSLKQVIGLLLIIIVKVLKLTLQHLKLVHQFIVGCHCIIMILMYSGDFIEQFLRMVLSSIL